MEKEIERFDFFGTLIHAVNQDKAIDYLKDYDFNQTGYVSFPDSSVVATAQKNPELQEILNNAKLTLPDGKPSEMYAKIKGYKGVTTVSGYWVCKQLLDTELTHYFLGSTDSKLAKIKNMIELEHPKAKVLGYGSPPFHPLEFFKEGNILNEAIKRINELSPDLIWVGISSPKQDFLLKHHLKHFDRGLMLGVGGVFDYLSGEVKKSPEWIKKMGFRWLWRLCQEPKRLGTKYWLTIKILAISILTNKK